MRKQDINRAFLFTVFFGIGIAALGFSVLLQRDLFGYYQNKRLIESAERTLDRLESLNSDYEALLERVDKDPNLIENIAPAIVGTESREANTVYPKAPARKLAAARKALAEELTDKASEPNLPEWLIRCSEPRRRTLLFLAGASLIILSFVCFGVKN